MWLSLCTGIANSEFASLIAQFGSAYALFRAQESEIEALGVSDALKGRLCDKRLDEAYGIVEYCQKHGVGILCYTDPAYPSTLRAIQAPPCVLYYKGKLPDFEKRLFISMVGTRSMSEYGKEMAYRIAYELASTGTVIVSGMALGVDAACAVGALAARGCTVAVLGCGIDVVYPRQHERLMHAIAEQGLVITEFPPATPPRGYHFPLRNRIISGLGAGTLVVEADLGSGALITAREAIVQGKDIYAVPGNVGDANTSGTNALIRKGAKLVVCAEDILEEYELLYPDRIFTENIALRKHRYKAEVSDFVMEEAPVQQEEEIPAPKEEEKRTPTKKRKEKAALQTESAPAVKEETRKIEDSCDNADYREILSLIKNDMSAEEMAALLSAKRGEACDIGTLLANLTMMEIEGLICAVPGGKYRLA